MWGIPALIFLIAFLHRAAPGVLAKELMQAFGITGTVVGLLSAMYFYSYAGFMVPGGVLIDSLGPRRVITAGGAVMLVGDELYRVQGHDLDVVDTTGAGDVFRGAFIDAYLRGEPPPGILRFANAAAAVSCTRTGAIDGVPTRDEIDRLLSTTSG